MNIEDIELEYNLDFEPEIKNKYANIIIDLFNNNCPDYYINNDDLDIQIIIALYYFSKNDYDKSINILLDVHNNGYVRATCSLGILYNILNDKDKSIIYFIDAIDKNHIQASTNLAYEFLCQGKFDLFLFYNKIGLDNGDQNALINLAIYYWNINKEHNKAIEIFNNLFNNNSFNYRAYYEYAKLVKDINQKKEYLIKAIQLKPKKCYIDMLTKITGNYERYILYIKNNIYNSTTIKYLENNISKYSRCPTCFHKCNMKKELFTLKCNHSFCNNCIMKHCNIKCCICYY